MLVKKTITLMPAPTATQPGGYVEKAYADRDEAKTREAELTVDKNNGIVVLRWKCDEPVKDASDNPRQFIDSAAVLAPEKKDAPWITMGAPGLALTGALWRADKEKLYQIKAEGMGSVIRSNSPVGWKSVARWKSGYWTLELTLLGWDALRKNEQIAVAIWQGNESERGGLKSVSPGWIDLS